MSDEPRNPIQWKLTGPAGPVRPGQAYGLQNIWNGKSVVYGERDTGINLVWGPGNAGGSVTPVRGSGSLDTIKHGDFFAITVKGGKYLRYHKRTVAVNLGWSDKPLEEWQAIGGQAGEPLLVGQPFALKNKVEDDVLVYAVREFGIDLRWDKDYQLIGDRSLTGKILELGVDAAMKYAVSMGVPPAMTARVGGGVKTRVRSHVT